jgi:hypothetical protein
MREPTDKLLDVVIFIFTLGLLAASVLLKIFVIG